MPHRSGPLAEILALGVRAPNCFNAQMWQVRITSELSFSIQPNPTWSSSSSLDPENRELWISIGAFIETCVLAAADRGYQTITNNRKGEISLLFQPDPKPQKSHHSATIIKRRTSRWFFSSKLPTDLVIEMTRISSQNTLYFQRYSRQGELIAKIILEASEKQVGNPEKRRQVMKWHVRSMKEDIFRKDGISARSYDGSLVGRFLYFLFINPKAYKSPKFGKFWLSHSAKQLERCAGFVLILSDKQTPGAQVYAGRELQRIWLELTKRNVCAQPMSQPMEEGEEFEQRLIDGLQLGNKRIQMILRVGQCQKVFKGVSKRKSIEDILVP